MVKRQRRAMPSNEQNTVDSTDFFQFSLNMEPQLFEILMEDYLHNQEDDSGNFTSEDVTAVLTTENLDIKYVKSNEERTVNFSGSYTISALPEQFSAVFAKIVTIKAMARQMKSGGMDWIAAVDTALNMSSARRGGWGC